MAQWVGLLRGINVGGGNKVPMAPLRQRCEELGWHDVQSYIASGNLVFDAEGDAVALSEALRRALVQHFAVDVPVMVLSAETFAARIASCPYPQAAGKAVHGFFCASQPVLDHEMITALIDDTEAITAIDRMVWMHTPDGFGRSALAGRIDRVIRETTFTARNLNTIGKLSQMLDRAHAS